MRAALSRDTLPRLRCNCWRFRQGAHHWKTLPCAAAPAARMRQQDRTPPPLRSRQAKPFTAPFTTNTAPISSIPKIGVITCFVKMLHAKAPSAPCGGGGRRGAR